MMARNPLVSGVGRRLVIVGCRDQLMMLDLTINATREHNLYEDELLIPLDSIRLMLSVLMQCCCHSLTWPILFINVLFFMLTQNPYLKQCCLTKLRQINIRFGQSDWIKSI